MVYFGGFFAKLEFSQGFLHLSLILPFIYVPLPSVCSMCMYVTNILNIRRGRIYYSREE